MELAQTTLGAVCDFLSGNAWKAELFSDCPDGIPIIRIQNLGDNKNEKFVYWNNEYQEKYLVEVDDILVSLSGSFKVVRWRGSKGLLNQRIVKVIPKQNVDSQWLTFFLERSLLLIAKMGRHALVSNVALSDLKNLPLALPTLTEQRRIVDILFRAEGIVRLRRDAEKKAAELIPALFLDMFGDPATNPKGLTVKSLGELIIDGPQNGLYKHASFYGEGTPILRIDGFYDGRVVNLNALKRVRITPEERQKFRLQERDIVINRVNSVEYLGKSAIIPFLNEETVFESNMMRFTVSDEVILPEYLIAYLQTAYAKARVLSNAKHAINQSSINQQDVKSFLVPVPPIRQQVVFAERAEQVRSIQYQQTAATAKAQATFDALLAQVFAGSN